MKNLPLIITFLLSIVVSGQVTEEELPYAVLPEYPETYTAETMAGRMIDALGFRYYWSTQDLKESDLKYKINEDARSTEETIDHILNLSYVIVNATQKKPNQKSDTSEMDFSEKRKQTLINLKTAADILKASDDISQYKLIFDKGELPFWNNVNGPIADAIWHCGQIASFRRMTGNPINKKVDHLMGTVKE